MLTKEQILKIVDEMSIDELVGQVINYDLGQLPPFDMEDLEKICKETMPGTLYAGPKGTTEESLAYSEMIANAVNKYAKVPTAITTDGGMAGIPTQMTIMGWGAINNVELTEKYAYEYARHMREIGHHILLGPVVDINYNKDNPITSTRSFSDSPDHVIKMAGAFVEGLAKDNVMVACCKHFPGDGMDDRNQHYCTSVNSKSKEDWMNTYGRVYKEMFKRGCKSVMCAHISLPSWQPEEEIDPICGYLPCSLSKALMTDLLKGELGFDGCIISDAMNMVGVVAVCPREEMGIRYINAGGDVMLFAHPEDFYYIRDAVLDGRIPMERIKDAVTRVLVMKNSIGLLDNDPVDLTHKYDVKELLKEASESVIKIHRNFDNVIPLKLNKGDRVLMITFLPERDDARNKDVFKPIRDDLIERGYKVTEIFTPFAHTVLENVSEEYDCVLINSCVDPFYSSAGSMRLGDEHMGAFWDGYGLKHPKMVYTAFGSPYQLYELPFLHTFINTYAKDPDTQRNALKVIFGELEAKGQSPVALPGFFERDVD